MKKSLLTAALACALSIVGFVSFAEDYTSRDKVTFENGTLSSTGSDTLQVLMTNPKIGSAGTDLSSFLTTMAGSTERKFGYMRNADTSNEKFYSLADLLTSIDSTAVDEAKIASISLGKFQQGETIQFGYLDSNGFEATSISPITVGSDSMFHTGYDTDSFFQLDFSEDPFNGSIEILVMGEPLPASTVTLLVALAAGAGFLLFHNRRRHAHSAVQA